MGRHQPVEVTARWAATNVWKWPRTQVATAQKAHSKVRSTRVAKTRLAHAGVRAGAVYGIRTFEWLSTDVSPSPSHLPVPSSPQHACVAGIHQLEPTQAGGSLTCAPPPKQPLYIFPGRGGGRGGRSRFAAGSARPHAAKQRPTLAFRWPCHFRCPAPSRNPQAYQRWCGKRLAGACRCGSPQECRCGTCRTRRLRCPF